MKRKKKRRKRKKRKSKSYALDKSTFDLPKHLWIFFLNKKNFILSAPVLQILQALGRRSSTHSWHVFTLKLLQQMPKIILVRPYFCGNLWFSYGHFTRKIGYAFLAITFLCCDKTDFYLNKWYRSNDSYGFNTGNKENLFLLQHSLYCLVARPVSFVSSMIGLLV